MALHKKQHYIPQCYLKMFSDNNTHIWAYDKISKKSYGVLISDVWKSHATLTPLAKQDLPTFGYNMIALLKSWCWGSILFYPFKISRFS